jgi:hypothetical protein
MIDENDDLPDDDAVQDAYENGMDDALEGRPRRPPTHPALADAYDQGYQHNSPDRPPQGY